MENLKYFQIKIKTKNRETKSLKSDFVLTPQKVIICCRHPNVFFEQLVQPQPPVDFGSFKALV